MPSTRALIHAPWSASKVATALRCPRLFHFKYIEKIKEPEVMPEARIGKSIHKALELVLMGTPIGEAKQKVREELPNETEQMRFDNLGIGIETFATRIQQFRRRRRVARQLVEYSLAIREDLSTTQFYSGDAYYRGVIDLGYIFADDSIALVDHKTGARIPGTSIADQLEGYAVLAAAAFRHVRSFWLGLHWIAERAGKGDLWIRDEQIVEEPEGGSADRTIDAAGCIVMAGGIDIHSHIAGGNVSTARLLLPEQHAAHVARPAMTPLSNAGWSTFETGCLYARMGFTTVVEPAMSPGAALHTHLELADIRAAIAGSPGVAGVHDLHVWSLSSDDVSLSVHVALTAGSDSDTVRRGVAKVLAERFAIEHATIQTEGPGGATRRPAHP